MRHGLPLWYSLTEETQKKLAPMLTEDVPPPIWKEWYPDIIAISEGSMTHMVFPDDFDYDTFMSQPPRPKRIRNL